jgi:hypothetical protein
MLYAYGHKGRSNMNSGFPVGMTIKDMTDDRTKICIHRCVFYINKACFNPYMSKKPKENMELRKGTFSM